MGSNSELFLGANELARYERIAADQSYELMDLDETLRECEPDPQLTGHDVDDDFVCDDEMLQENDQNFTMTDEFEFADKVADHLKLTPKSIGHAKVREVKKVKRRSHLKRENETATMVKILLFFQNIWQFEMVMDFYGHGCRHLGNRGNCYVHFVLNTKCQNQPQALQPFFLHMFDFLRKEKYRRLFFKLPKGFSSHSLIRQADNLGKLKPFNCDIDQLKGDDKKLLNIAGLFGLFLRSNQLISNIRWNNGKLDDFPLFLPVFKKMELHMENLAGQNASYEQVHGSKELWDKFRRDCKEKLMPCRSNIQVACLAKLQ